MQNILMQNHRFNFQQSLLYAKKSQENYSYKFIYLTLQFIIINNRIFYLVIAQSFQNKLKQWTDLFFKRFYLRFSTCQVEQHKVVAHGL